MTALVKPGPLPALHPFLLASYSALTLVANNLGETESGGGRLILVSLLAAGAIYLVAWLGTREWLKSGALASAGVLLFFSYGHVLNLLQALAPAFRFSGGLILLWLVLFVAWSRWVLRKAPVLSSFSTGLTVIAAALNLFPLFTILTFNEQQASLHDIVVEYADREPIAALTLPDGPPPDVFYIILDAYGRADVLKDLYGYDNSDFVRQLERRGFGVDPHAITNYTHSEISMGSSLNMRHFTDLPDTLRSNGITSDEGAIRQATAEMIQLSAVRRSFEALGYTSVNFDSGYIRTRMDSADIFVQSPEIESVSTWQIGLEFMLLDSSMGRGLIDLFGPDLSPHARLFEAHRQRVLFTLDHLADYAGANGDYFVFAHVISPHVPFVFDADGNPLPSTDPYTLLDAHGGDPANIGLYADQLHYLNTRVLAAVDSILQHSSTPPIIILQGDHGSKVYSEPDPPLEIMMRLYLPMLNAILADGVDFYPGMTPVNTFRMILNSRFGGQLALQPDISYLLEQVEGTWEFVDACQLYPACAGLSMDSDG